MIILGGTRVWVDIPEINGNRLKLRSPTEEKSLTITPSLNVYRFLLNLAWHKITSTEHPVSIVVTTQ